MVIFSASCIVTWLTLEGDTCYCGNDLNVAPCNYPGWPSYCGGKPAYPLECTQPCAGDPSYECGNALVLNLYIAGEAAPSPSQTAVVLHNNLNAQSAPASATQSSAAIPTVISYVPAESSGMSMDTNPTLDPTNSALPNHGVNAEASANSVAITPSITTTGNSLSTSTVYDTTTITVISCAPTVRNCPARSTGMSLASSPIAIVVYSTKWITISSCAPVITNCPYNSVSTSMVPIITINLSNNPPFPTPTGNTVVQTASPTPKIGAGVPSNGTTAGNYTISIVSGAVGNCLGSALFPVVAMVFFGMFWAWELDPLNLFGQQKWNWLSWENYSGFCSQITPISGSTYRILTLFIEVFFISPPFTIHFITEILFWLTYQYVIGWNVFEIVKCCWLTETGSCIVLSTLKMLHSYCNDVPLWPIEAFCSSWKQLICSAKHFIYPQAHITSEPLNDRPHDRRLFYGIVEVLYAWNAFECFEAIARVNLIDRDSVPSMVEGHECFKSRDTHPLFFRFRSKSP